MKRLLTRRADIAVVSRSTATLAASRQSVAVVMRGRYVSRRCIDRERDSCVRLNRVSCGDRSNGHWHGDLSIRRGIGRGMAGEVGLENRIGARMYNRGNRRRRLGGLEGREACVDERIVVRLWSLNGLVDVRLWFRIDVNADETIALRGLAHYGRRLAP